METIKTTLTTTAVFSDDGNKRYLLTKTWEEDKPSLAIVNDTLILDHSDTEKVYH